MVLVDLLFTSSGLQAGIPKGKKKSWKKKERTPRSTLRTPLSSHIYLTIKPGALLPNGALQFPFYIATKRGGSGLWPINDGDWLFIKESDGEKVGAGTSEMTADARYLIRQDIYLIMYWIMYLKQGHMLNQLMLG